MRLTNDKLVNIVQANSILSLKEYEKSKAMIKQEGNECNTDKFANILFYANQIHKEVAEKTLEHILFKFFIGDLSMKKIIQELLLNNKNFHDILS